MATEFINRVDSEEQRQALFQVVENNRAMVKNTNKSSLKFYTISSLSCVLVTCLFKFSAELEIYSHCTHL